MPHRASVLREETLPALVAALMLAGCGEPTSTAPDVSRSAPRINLSLHLDADTVDSKGVIQVGVIGPDSVPTLAWVDFTLVWTDSTSSGSPATLETMSLITNTRGHGVIGAALGDRAGEASLIANVFSMGLADTVPFEITPGASHRITSTLPEALFLDSLYPITVASLDRHDNPVPGARPVLVWTSDNLHVDSVAMTARGTAIGQASVLWADILVADTSSTVVMPLGSIAYAYIRRNSWGGQELVLRASNLDGSNARDVDVQQFGGVTAFGLHPTWSLDGERLAYWDSTRAIHIDNLQGSTVAVASGVAPNARLSWTADRQWLYFTRDDTETWRARTDGSGSERVVRGLGRVSPDGRYLALRDGALWLYEIATGAKTRISDAGVATWSRDGTRILALNSEGSVRIEVYQLDGTVTRTIAFGSGWTGSARISVSPDGAFAFVDAGGIIAMVGLETGAWHQLPYLPIRAAEADWGSRMLP